VLFNPFLPEFHADPSPFHRRLREEDSVHQTPMGFWVLTRYADCVAVLRDAR
jgi:cytochrome P450